MTKSEFDVIAKQISNEVYKLAYLARCVAVDAATNRDLDVKHVEAVSSLSRNADEVRRRVLTALTQLEAAFEQVNA